MENDIIVGIVLILGLVDLIFILCFMTYAFVYLCRNIRAESQVSSNEESTSDNQQPPSLDEAVRKAFFLALNRHKQLQEQRPDNVTTDNINEARRSDTNLRDGNEEPSETSIRDDGGKEKENNHSEIGNDSGAIFNFGECDVEQLSNRISKSNRFAAADDSGHKSDSDDGIDVLLDEAYSEHSEDYESSAEGDDCDDF